MNDKEQLKLTIKALIEDYSEFISRKVTAYAQDLNKHPSDIPQHMKMTKMIEWVEEFVDIAAENFHEVN